jgi:Fe2+ or Zn2+ uptake regulation protein
MIEDNGIGRKKAMRLNEENKKPHEHLGMKVTGKRINLLQSMNHNKIEMDINDIGHEGETGTRVTFIFPEYFSFE